MSTQIEPTRQAFRTQSASCTMHVQGAPRTKRNITLFHIYSRKTTHCSVSLHLVASGLFSCVSLVVESDGERTDAYKKFSSHKYVTSTCFTHLTHRQTALRTSGFDSHDHSAEGPKAAKTKDYYEILGIPKSASQNEIKKAFHQVLHHTS